MRRSNNVPAILQVVPALESGGVERGTVEIVEALNVAGFRALVASAGGAMVRQVEAAGGQHFTLPMRSKSPISLASNARALVRLATAEDVRIIHARSRFPAWSARWAARRADAAFVTTYHGAYNESGWLKHKYNSVMAGGDRVIAVSEYVAQLVRDRYGIGESRLRVIPRGVDPAMFDPSAVDPARVSSLREAWKVPPGRKILLLPGRLTRWKGQSTLLRAVAELLPTPPYCLLVGEGSYRKELEHDVARLGLAGHVALPGKVDHMEAALLLADLVIHASTDPEAFGRTVIEAQAMERPVIASDLGGPRETVEPGVTGWLVPPGDARALADAITEVLGLPIEERRAVGERARRSVMGRYTKAAMQAATLSVYRELL